MPRRVILDTDTGVDDALAIILAMRSPEISVEAITGVCGNTSLEKCVRNIHLTLDVLELQAIPEIARGEDQPLVGHLSFAGDIHGDDGLGDVTQLLGKDGRRIYPDPTYQLSPRHAVDVILENTNRYLDELTIVAVGPLTNVARAIIKNPDRMRRLQEIIIMGGAFETRGNVSHVAEFNIYSDPHAAQIVCESGIPLIFVPLDVTRQALLSSEIISRYSQEGGVTATFVRDCTSRYVEFHQRSKNINGCFLHDPLAVAIAIREDLVTLVPAQVDVETAGNLTMGMTVADLRLLSRSTHNARVCTALDVQDFLTLFTERVLA